MPGDNLEAQLRAAIVAYVAAHPNASDTADGIARWWLGAMTIPVEAVIGALERLVEEECLVRMQDVGGVIRYAARSRSQP